MTWFCSTEAIVTHWKADPGPNRLRCPKLESSPRRSFPLRSIKKVRKFSFQEVSTDKSEKVSKFWQGSNNIWQTKWNKRKFWSEITKTFIFQLRFFWDEVVWSNNVLSKFIFFFRILFFRTFLIFGFLSNAVLLKKTRISKENSNEK